MNEIDALYERRIADRMEWDAYEKQLIAAYQKEWDAEYAKYCMSQLLEYVKPKHRYIRRTGARS